MNKFPSLFLILIASSFFIHAQDTIQKQRSFGFSVGLQRESINLIEIGVTREVGFPGTALFMRTPSHSSVLLFNGHKFISAILSFSPQHKTIGYQINYARGGIFAYGVSANCYENGKDFQIGLMPEFGIIISRFQFLYGYNFKIAGDKSIIPSGHSIRFCCYIPIIGKMNGKAYEDQKPRKKKNG